MARVILPEALRDLLLHGPSSDSPQHQLLAIAIADQLTKHVLEPVASAASGKPTACCTQHQLSGMLQFTPVRAASAVIPCRHT